ncbi:hypothetical protein E8E11_001572 [Didymella keratinophila]|nr:hypothetical protein E8E11_001572 [Didymella keratinophila]
MARVYGNSYCTLAALSSVDGSGGCHHKDNVQGIMDNTFFDLQTPSPSDQPYVRIFRKEPNDWSTEYDGGEGHTGQTQSPLRYRAWVLQERELSRRSIHFGQNQLLWECKQMKGSAQLPWLEMKKKRGLTYPEGWFQLTEDYSLRDLTKSKDKLPALAGIAEVYQGQHAQYLAGLWSDQLPAALMWHSLDANAKRHEAYRAPSWSWASLQGGISYDSQRLVPPFEEYPNPQDNPPRMLKNVYKGLKLEHAVVELTRREHIYGQINGAYLILKGAVLLDIDMPRQRIPFNEREAMKAPEPLFRHRRQIGVFYRDSFGFEDVSTAKTAFLLVVQEEHQFPLSEHPFQLHQLKNMIQTVMGIIVVGDERHRDSLRRLGVGRWVDQNLVARCRPNTVKLV